MKQQEIEILRQVWRNSVMPAAKNHGHDFAKLPTDGVYVEKLRCEKWHSGNKRYVQDGAWCHCQGCGDMRATSSLWAELKQFPLVS